MEVAAGLLQADIAPVERTLTELLLEGQLIQEQLPGEDGIFLPGMFRTEQDCALRLLRLQGQSALDQSLFPAQGSDRPAGAAAGYHPGAGPSARLWNWR